ncbi:MAG: acyl-CoA thioesterase [Candidatus Rokubacteria bacterium]|nr:acyl-CoA thioesterase [Candidatus Rokubacteria bacterium]
MVSVTHVRVRYKDTDCMKIVYYGNYLTYFEVGRVEFLRQSGHPMSEVDAKLHMPVVEAFVKYVKPARLDDLLEVRCWISEKRRASFTFSYEIRDEARELVTTGYTRHACAEPATGRLIAIPDWLGTVMKAETGAG